MAAPMVQMTTEQLQQLIEAVKISAAGSAAAAASEAAAINPKKTIGNCSRTFDGQRDYDIVEAFITAVVTFKEIEGISDEEALRGISLLFRGSASTWWQGVRKEAKTWNDAIKLIREHFSPAKPNYQIYMDIFENKQDDDTAIDTFVIRKRALYSQLPEGRHDEETELDFTFGLLNINYRKHIARTDIRSFRELLEKGRVVEQNRIEQKERMQHLAYLADQRERKRSKRCTYCNFRGHTIGECRKRKEVNNDGDTAQE